MFSKMEMEYFEKFMESQFDNINAKLDTQIQLQKVANGRTSKLEDEIDKIKDWKATSVGHWSGVNKVITIVGSIIGGIVGVVAAYLFKS